MVTYVTRPDAHPVPNQLAQSISSTSIAKVLMCLSVVLCLAPHSADGMDAYVQSEATKSYELTGTLVELDLVRGKGLIRTDFGQPMFLDVRRVELLSNLSVGDRITIQVAGDGQVDKVMGVKVPDLAITGLLVPPQP